MLIALDFLAHVYVDLIVSATNVFVVFLSTINKHFLLLLLLQNKKQFKVAHINVNSIIHKIEPLREVLQNNVFDILAIQETKIDD